MTNNPRGRVTVQRLNEASSSIKKAFLEAPSARGEGASKLVFSETDSNAFAWGQHVRSDTTQRGFHGVAAAIHVFAYFDPNESKHDEARSCVERLVTYLADFAAIEQAILENGGTGKSSAKQQSNTVKLAELLLSLCIAPTGLSRTYDSNTEGLRNDYEKNLLAGRVPTLKPGTGTPVLSDAWGFQLGDSRPHPVPTAYAVMALTKKGVNVQGSLDWLRQQLKPADQQYEQFTQVLVLYALHQASMKKSPGAPLRGELQPIFRRLWRKLSPLMSQGQESTVEYFVDRSRYIHIPWQLYLLELAADFAPRWAFSSWEGRACIEGLLTQVEEHQLVTYAMSGSEPSSRTNAIALGTFRVLADAYRKGSLYHVIEAAYAVRHLLRTRVAVWLVRITAAAWTVLFFATGFSFFVDRPVAAGITGSILMLLLTIGRNLD